MPSFNQVILMGNVTRDPQLKFLSNQTAVVEFGLAVNRKFRTQQGEDREEVTFVDCVAFAKSAELISQYVTKGKPLFVVGRLRYESWEDKQGGGKRSKITVTVENFQFLGSRDDSPRQDAGQGQGGAPARATAGKGGWPFEGDKPFNPDDLPY